MSFFHPFKKANAGLATAIDSIVVHVGNYKREEEATYRLFVGQAAQWRKALQTQVQPHGLAAEYRGVFCHKKPQVNFTDATGAKIIRELGDALLVFSFKSKAGEIRRSALLLQAKRTTNTSLTVTANTVSTKEPGQWCLYTTWPAFTHSLDSTGQTPKQFGGSRQSPLSRARHVLLFDKHGCLNAAQTGVPSPQPSPKFRDARSLSSTVEACLSGLIAHGVAVDLSRPVELAKRGASDWSVVVASICQQVASGRAGKYASPGSPGVARGAGALMALGQVAPSTHGPSGTAGSGGPDDDAPTDGFAVVSIGLAFDDADAEDFADEIHASSDAEN